jgi:hypothetical protein
MQGVQFPGLGDVHAALKKNLAMVRENLTEGCLQCQNDTAQNPQTCCRCKGNVEPPPDRLGSPTVEIIAFPPVTVIVPPSYDDEAYTSDINDVLLGQVFIHDSPYAALAILIHRPRLSQAVMTIFQMC